MNIRKRLLVALIATFCLVAASVGFAPPTSAGTYVANTKTDCDLRLCWEYPNPGSNPNPFKVHNVPLNVWQPLQYGGCSQEVRIGYFYNYPYAEMRYVSGTCSFGGISRVNVTTSSDLGGAGQIWTSPQYDVGPGLHQVCVIGSQSVNSPCVQSGSGSIWNQQKTNTGPPRTILGANAVICGPQSTRFPLVPWYYYTCLAVNFGVF